jgi:hypothetical protein
MSAEPLNEKNGSRNIRKMSIEVVQSDSVFKILDNLTQVDAAIESKKRISQSTNKAITSNLDKRIIVLNARGVKFEVLVRTLDNVPNGRLNIIKHVIDANEHSTYKTVDLEKLEDVCEHFTDDLNEFYFNKNPVVFQNILKFYQQPVLEKKTHINLQDVCPLEQEEEFKYWNIDWEEYLDVCCSVKLDDMRYKLHAEIRETNQIIESLTSEVSYRSKLYPNIRRKIWNVMENPKSSVLAYSFLLFSTLLRVLSILNVVLSSFPKLRGYQTGQDFSVFDKIDSVFIGWWTFGNFKLFIISKKANVLSGIGFFIKEMIARFVVCPNFLKQMFSIFNIFDLLVILPFYFWFAFAWWTPMDNIDELSRVFRVFGLFRLFRISNSLSGLNLTIISLIFFIMIFIHLYCILN